MFFLRQLCVNCTRVYCEKKLHNVTIFFTCVYRKKNYTTEQFFLYSCLPQKIITRLYGKKKERVEVDANC